MSTRLAPVAAHAHMQDRGTPPAGLMRQAPDHRVTTNALAPAASTPPVLTSNTARQHCMVCLNALTRHLQPQAIQARERAQIRAIKDSIGHVEVFQMDGVGTPIIERPRPLPGHDTPNPTQHPYTPNYEEPLITQKQFLGVVPGSMRRPPDLRAMRLIGQVVLVFGLSFVATKPKGGGWTRCDLSSWLARSCWFYPGF